MYSITHFAGSAIRIDAIDLQGLGRSHDRRIYLGACGTSAGTALAALSLSRLTAAAPRAFPPNACPASTVTNTRQRSGGPYR